MSNPGKETMAKLYKLMIILVMLQALAVGLVIRFAGDSFTRDQTILERTAAMMQDVFPGMQRDLSTVSERTAQIHTGVGELKQQVTQVHERVGDVGTRLEGLDQTVTGYIDDKSGVIWGHSLNPYLLLTLLIAGLVGVPAWLWHFSRKAKLEAPHMTMQPDDSPLESFSCRLDRLSVLVEQISKEDQSPQPETKPELQKLIVETERLIREARQDLAKLSSSIAITGEEGDGELNKLH
jgi:hypothetical protein